MKQLSGHIIEHDDPCSETHAKDKAGKRERNKRAWEPVPAPQGQRSPIMDGLTDNPVEGFCFRFRNGEARRADGEEYQRDAKAMEKTNRKGKRIRIREGKEVRDSQTFRNGAVAVVVSTPPWAWGAVKALPPSQRDFLMLRLAEKSLEAIGRPGFGGGIHYDGNAENAFYPHIHLHLPKTDPKTGFVMPKSSLIWCDQWTANTHRIMQKFPHLIGEKKQQWVKDNLKKKTGRVINIEAQTVVDRELEAFFASAGLSDVYEESIAEYIRWKTHEQETVEPRRRVMANALAFWTQTKVWPIAFRAMSRAMWRMIPRELRPTIALAIRAEQIISKPLLARTDRKISRLLHIVREIDQPKLPGLAIR